MTSDPPTLSTLAASVASHADALAKGTLRNADRERVATLVSSLASAPNGTRNCDLLLALAVAVAIQGQLTSDEMGYSPNVGVSIICAALGILAQTVDTIEVPPPGERH